MAKYKVIMNYSDGTSDEQDEILDSKKMLKNTLVIWLVVVKQEQKH